MASTPDRLKKDLANAKALAAILEEEYATLRNAKVALIKSEKNGDPAASANGDVGDATQNDAAMAETVEEEEDPEPRELGSEAVERRIEKVMVDLQEQGQLDLSDEVALEAKKVRFCGDLVMENLS